MDGVVLGVVWVCANISLLGNTVQKYPDGTMIIEAIATVNGAISVAWGSTLFYANFVVTFPESFFSVSHVVATIVSSNSAIVIGAIPTPAGATVSLARSASTPTQAYTIAYRAKGRWKA